MYSDPLQLTITDHGALGWRVIIIYRKLAMEIMLVDYFGYNRR